MPETYTVKAGDTLSKIAMVKLGDFNRWRELAELNKLANPNLLKIGQVLQMPRMSATPVVNAPPAPTDEFPPEGAPIETVITTAPKYPWGLILAGIAATLYFFSRKR